jgi:hypothetical protein
LEDPCTWEYDGVVDVKITLADLEDGTEPILMLLNNDGDITETALITREFIDIECFGPNFPQITRTCGYCGEGCESCQSAILCDNCYKGYQLDPSYSYCMPCNMHMCLDCSSGFCDECDTDWFTYYGKCTDDCGIGYFKDYNTSSCEECPTGCSTCDGLTSCPACDEGYQFISDYECESCHEDCEICANNKCLSCYGDLYIDETDTCVADCGAKKFGDWDTGYC